MNALTVRRTPHGSLSTNSSLSNYYPPSAMKTHNIARRKHSRRLRYSSHLPLQSSPHLISLQRHKARSLMYVQALSERPSIRRYDAYVRLSHHLQRDHPSPSEIHDRRLHAVALSHYIQRLSSYIQWNTTWSPSCVSFRSSLMLPICTEVSDLTENISVNTAQYLPWSEEGFPNSLYRLRL
jgi:hypothetical protein